MRPQSLLPALIVESPQAARPVRMELVDTTLHVPRAAFDGHEFHVELANKAARCSRALTGACETYAVSCDPKALKEPAERAARRIVRAVDAAARVDRVRRVGVDWLVGVQVGCLG